MKSESKGDDVKKLQKILAQDKSLYPEGLITGYFGPMTLAAVKKFQVKYGIAKPGDDGYGHVGPKTRAVLNGY
jgi:peptidoglycan hydrolase-like protein with peptidoglycan-binding domain